MDNVQLNTGIISSELHTILSHHLQ